MPDPGNNSFRWSFRHNQNEDITLMGWKQPATVLGYIEVLFYSILLI